MNLKINSHYQLSVTGSPNYLEEFKKEKGIETVKNIKHKRIPFVIRRKLFPNVKN